MQQDTQAITYGRHIRALVTLGIPIIIGQLGTIIQGLADTIMVGNYSARSLAAAGFVNNVMMLVLIFALGYSYALTPVIGPMHARNEHDNAGRSLKAALQANGTIGTALFVLMGVLYFFLDRMGQPEELLPEIRPYYVVVLLSVPIQSLFNAFKQFFDGIGNGLGFTIAITVIGLIREFIGAGTLFGLTVLPEAFPDTLIMIMSPGAFFTYGTLMAIFHRIMAKQKAKKAAEEAAA